jgi:hypothetical protein
VKLNLEITNCMLLRFRVPVGTRGHHVGDGGTAASEGGVFENGEVRGVFGAKRDGVTGEWKNFIMRSFMIRTHPLLCG